MGFRLAVLEDKSLVRLTLTRALKSLGHEDMANPWGQTEGLFRNPQAGPDGLAL
jgi:hypothetical protein